MAFHDEEARLEALYRLNLLDTAPAESFDRITRMASQIFGLPISAVSLTDRDRQWFKSRVGVSHTSIPRDRAPCAQVAETAELLVVPDLLAHDCYQDSTLARQGIRFYAGASLTTREGHSLGALCVLGTEPRTVSDAETAALVDLAKIVMNEIELQHAFGRIDPISGLPNRFQFLEDLADLGRDRPGERRLAVLVDLARNEQLSSGVRVMGSDYLEEIVRETGASIAAALGPGRKAYHVAATQFAFLARPNVDEEHYPAFLATMLERVRATSRARFVMTTTIGVAPLIAGETDPAAVLRTAHSAAQDARHAPTMVSVYSSDADQAHQRRFRLLQDFGAALAAPGELSLVFQPRIDLVSGDCVGAEALLRWQHPELGWISPAEFIPIIEQTALVGPATSWVLKQGLRQLGAWRADGRAIQLAINVSAANLEQADFAEEVRQSLASHALSPDMLELEVTESAMMQNVEISLAQISALSEAGVRIAIDDFGTGYSSLAYLQRLPARVLKIDQSFVSKMLESDRDSALVSSMISLAHELGFRVVAEGIETVAVLHQLTALGCDEGQGYLFGRPMTAADFALWCLAKDRGSALVA